MSQAFQHIGELVARGDITTSAHGSDELAAHGLLVRAILASSDGLAPRSITVVRGFHEETSMTRRRHIKLVREGEYIAEVEMELINTGEGWSPYLSLEEAQKLDDIREPLRRGDFTATGKLSRFFHLTPVTV